MGGVRSLKILMGCWLTLWSTNVRANVVGADTQNFNPLTSGLDFVTVHSSETLAPGMVNFGLFLNYAVNSLPNYQGPTPGDRTNFADSLLSADLNFGMGLLPNLDVGLSFPQLLRQSVDSDLTGPRAEFASTGLTEIRGNAKYRFWGDERQGIATVVSMNMNQIKNNPFAGENAGPTFNFELVADTTLDNGVALAANIGYRARNPGSQVANIPIEPLPNQYIFSVAANYHLQEWDSKLIGEIFGSLPAEQQSSSSDRELSTAELLVGIKTDITPKLAFHAGAGTELIHGTSSPDWRVYTGINYAWGPIFSRDAEIVRVRDGETSAQALRRPKGPDEDSFKAVLGVAAETFVSRNILFDFNSDEFTDDFKNALDKMAAYMKKPPGFKMLTVEGHTDSIGKHAYNMELSQRRAEKVRAYLIREGGLPANRVRAAGMGPTKPVADNGNYQGRALNRRVEFIIQR